MDNANDLGWWSYAQAAETNLVVRRQLEGAVAIAIAIATIAAAAMIL